MRRGLLAFLLAGGLHAADPCPKPLDVPAGASLESLAQQYLGSPRGSIAIVLATNARTDQGFRYIPNPDDLTGVPRICIPGKSEARQLRRNWEAYERAVTTARLPRMSALNKELLTIPADQPVEVVAWVRKDQADRLATGPNQWVTAAPSETWVTVEPHLREFCRSFRNGRALTETVLTQRLEQRLGLAPASSKSTFVRIRLAHPGPDVIFRPCIDPAADRAGCSVGPPAKAPADYQLWFYRQYYSSYGQSLLSEFPWTALGYTFDWAPDPKARSAFQRAGESEFVIQKGAPIEIIEVLSTLQYCGS